MFEQVLLRIGNLLVCTDFSLMGTPISTADVPCFVFSVAKLLNATVTVLLTLFQENIPKFENHKVNYWMSCFIY